MTHLKLYFYLMSIIFGIVIILKLLTFDHYQGVHMLSKYERMLLNRSSSFGINMLLVNTTPGASSDHSKHSSIETLCTAGNKIGLLIPVHSAIRNKRRRDMIRKTWATVTTYKGLKIRHVFVVGKTENPTDMMKIKKEIYDHGDIIEGNYLDTYRNLTRKMVQWLQWVDSCNASIDYVMKCDDDVMVNPWAAINFIMKRRDPVIFGHTNKRLYPIRDKRNRWRISYTQWKQNNYVSYVDGFAELMSIEAVHRLNMGIKNNLVEKRFNATWTNFPIDDAYLGILANVSEVKVVDSYSFRTSNAYPISHRNCGACRWVATLTSGIKDMDLTWCFISKMMEWC